MGIFFFRIISTINQIITTSDDNLGIILDYTMKLHFLSMAILQGYLS